MTNVEVKQPDPKAKDRQGYAYADLLAIQARHLAWWELLLAPEHFKKLKQYCERTNKPAVEGAQWPHGLHTVPRGVSLANFLEDRAKFLLDDESDEQWTRDNITPHTSTAS